MSPRILSLLFATLAGLALVPGCKPKPKEQKQTFREKKQVAEREVSARNLFKPEVFGNPPSEDNPWISNAVVVDLDQDGLEDLIGCEGQKNTVFWVRQTEPGVFEEITLTDEMLAPAHVDANDIDDDGDLDILVACMGQIFPNNDLIGSVVILENDGQQNYTPHTVLDHVARVTDVRAADFDGDGLKDLAVAQFGYYEGEVRWMKNRGNWQFDSEILLSLPGAINVCIADMNGDRTLDIVTIISQQYEEVYLFPNNGNGTFGQKVLWGSTNQDYGSSNIRLADLNRDGRQDILYTNGDGFDYAEPGSRPWHGVQWLENKGEGFFQFHRIGDFKGAYSPVAADFDLDGDLDVVAVSGFNEWADPKSVSVMLFRNDGQMNFTPEVIANTPTHLIVADVIHIPGEAQPSLITGAFLAYPPFDHKSRLTVWRPTGE